jgi:hypothetical protein
MAPRIVLQFMQMMLTLVQALMASRVELALENLAPRSRSAWSVEIALKLLSCRSFRFPTSSSSPSFQPVSTSSSAPFRVPDKFLRSTGLHHRYERRAAA